VPSQILGSAISAATEASGARRSNYRGDRGHGRSLSMRILIFIVLSLAFSCTNEDGARSALQGAGYDNIELHGYSMRCSDSDGTCTEFTATGPTGHSVRGAVGCGPAIGCSKGCTIRMF
jgi:hypothetical protein